MSKLSLAQQSCLFQYLSLILIILAVLIATSRPKSVPVKLSDAKSFEAPSSQSGLNSEIILQDVFSEDSTSINTDSLEPLKEILLNHNLDINIKVESKNNSTARAFRLAQVLKEQGFWKDSFTITAFENFAIAKTNLVAKFEWSEP